MLSAPHVKNLTTSATASAEPQKSKKLIEILSTIPSVRPAYQGVSKLADSKRKKYIVPAKRILKPATTPKPALLIDETKPLDLTFIGTWPFQYLIKQKNIEIFAVFVQNVKNKLNAILMKNIKYQLNKTAKTFTNLKTMIFKEYHKFLDVFSKKASDTLSSHSKYNHQIHLLEKYKDHGYSPFSKISEPKLQFVKKFLEEHLKKGFIKASSVLCLL